MHGHYFKGSEECAVSWREGLCLGPCRRAEVSGESEGACWGRRGACARVAESLCCPPETVPTLLTDSTPIQNAKLFFFFKEYSIS